MRDAKLPIQYRDNCANLLIPLNRCRVDSYYLPWKCEVSCALPEFREMGGGEDERWMCWIECWRAIERMAANSLQNERHSYEKCQYEEFKLRVKKMDELKAAKGGERSN